MKKSRWIEPYTKNKNGKLVATIIDCWTCSEAGVYLIRNKRTEEIVYVGSSTTQLKKTIYRHFQQWTDRQAKTGKQFERKTYPKQGHYQIRFFKCTAAQALKLEKAFIHKYQPKDNPLKYEQLMLSMKPATIEKTVADAYNSDFIPKGDYMEPAPF